MMPLLIAVMAGASVAALLAGMLRRNPATVVAHQRVERLSDDSSVDPLTAPFASRAMLPAARWLVRVTTGLLPARIAGSLQHRLELAGEPMTAQRFLLIWASCGLAIPTVLVLGAVVLGGGISTTVLFAYFVWVAVGSYLPWLLLRRAGQRRIRAIQRDLPDAMDLVITNLEAGLGLQASLLTVSEKMAGPVGEEFGRAVRSINLGRNRSEAFMQMAERSGSAEMRLFARAVAQSEQTGIPIAHVLRNHAKESRERRRQHAREQAAKVPVKITLPTVLFMFPTIFLLILGPVIIYAIDLIGGGE
jgi:tight adherence protein C